MRIIGTNVTSFKPVWSSCVVGKTAVVAKSTFPVKWRKMIFWNKLRVLMNPLLQLTVGHISLCCRACWEVVFNLEFCCQIGISPGGKYGQRSAWSHYVSGIKDWHRIASDGVQLFQDCTKEKDRSDKLNLGFRESVCWTEGQRRKVRFESTGKRDKVQITCQCRSAIVELCPTDKFKVFQKHCAIISLDGVSWKEVKQMGHGPCFAALLIQYLCGKVAFTFKENTVNKYKDATILCYLNNQLPALKVSIMSFIADSIEALLAVTTLPASFFILANGMSAAIASAIFK